MRYTSFKIEKYKGIDNVVGDLSTTIKLQKNKSTALIGINECGKSTILKAIYAFDFRNDANDVQYKHLTTLKNRNKVGTSSETAIIYGNFALETMDVNWLITFFNSNNLFLDNQVEEPSNVEGETTLKNQTKTDEEKISIIQKAFKSFSIKCELSKNPSIVRNYKLIFNHGTEDGFFANIKEATFRTQEQNLCKKIIQQMPSMLYITDLPDFYSENNFSAAQDAKHEECKKLVNNLFVSATTKSLTVAQFFEVYKTDKAEYNSIKSQVKNYLTKEFSNRWNQFNLNKTFGDLDIDIDAQVESKTISIQVKEKGQGNDNYYSIEDRSMGFQWFFKFVMNISFHPLKEQGIVFLIDEPGTFLHETAQAILSKELNSMLHENYMIFSTHYYSMLNLKEVELNRIYIVERNAQSIVATKATDYKGYADADKKSPILPILNAFRKTVIDYIHGNESKKILIVEGLYDKYAISVFCKSPKWAEVEIFPSVGASQIADNMSEFAYYKKDILALFDNDDAGIDAYKKIKTNAMYIDVDSGYFEDSSKSLVMDNLFDVEELAKVSETLKNDGIMNYSTYKDVLKILYEDKSLVAKYKDLLQKTTSNFAKLENSILHKLKLIKKSN